MHIYVWCDRFTTARCFEVCFCFCYMRALYTADDIDAFAGRLLRPFNAQAKATNCKAYILCFIKL